METGNNSPTGTGTPDSGTGAKFLFELKDIKARDAKISEIVFIPSWLQSWNAEIITALMADHKKEEEDYQQVVKALIRRCGWMVVNILRESLVLFPVSKGKFQKQLFIGLGRQIISTGKIIEVKK